MEKPLIVILQQDKNLSRPELSQIWHLLKTLGFEVQVFTRAGQVLPLLKHRIPDLFILDQPLAEEITSLLPKKGSKCEESPPHQIVLKEGTFSEKLPFDILALHDEIVKHLIRHPRKHLRLPVRLPCVFSQNEMCFFGEILSLGTGGAFVKTAKNHLRVGELLDLGIPLIGMKKELEVKSKVLYFINSMPENSFLGGFGVGFLPQNPKVSQLLRDFIRFSLLNDINPAFCSYGPNALQNPMPGYASRSSSAVPPILSLKV
jgi:hypothetical protein